MGIPTMMFGNVHHFYRFPEDSKLKYLSVDQIFPNISKISPFV
jgi:hypothetical protein